MRWEKWTKGAYLLQVIQGVQLRAETAVNAEELLVHNGSQGQAAERLHASVVDRLRILVSALELEGEVVR